MLKWDQSIEAKLKDQPFIRRKKNQNIISTSFSVRKADIRLPSIAGTRQVMWRWVTDFSEICCLKEERESKSERDIEMAD